MDLPVLWGWLIWAGWLFGITLHAYPENLYGESSQERCHRFAALMIIKLLQSINTASLQTTCIWQLIIPDTSLYIVLIFGLRHFNTSNHLIELLPYSLQHKNRLESLVFHRETIYTKFAIYFMPFNCQQCEWLKSIVNFLSKRWIKFLWLSNKDYSPPLCTAILHDSQS